MCQIAFRKNHEVYAAYSQHKPLYGTPVELNILDLKAEQQALNKIKPDAVAHAAALTDVDKCEMDKELAWKTNVEATENLVRLCKKRNTFLVYVSTDYVFDGERGMYKETDTPAPINHYGLTKLKGEEAVQALDDYCIARGSNPPQQIRIRPTCRRNLQPRLKIHKTCQIKANQIGIAHAMGRQET